MSPVPRYKEIEGFVFNRLQRAGLRDAYCLARDGVAPVEDTDCIMREELGLRWSIIGPFETADLNVRGGIVEHAKRVAEVTGWAPARPVRYMDRATGGGGRSGAARGTAPRKMGGPHHLARSYADGRAASEHRAAIAQKANADASSVTLDPSA
jgi:3-hydroxyacyl-CoA dehydrogenase